jgi:hypothetical protein
MENPESDFFFLLCPFILWRAMNKLKNKSVKIATFQKIRQRKGGLKNLNPPTVEEIR